MSLFRPTVPLQLSRICWLLALCALVAGNVEAAVAPKPVIFAVPQNYSAGYIDHLAVADLNGDSNVDVVASADTSVTVFYGDGTGAISNGASFGGAYINTSVATGDLNQDGCLDFAVLDWSLQTLSIYVATNCSYTGASVLDIPEGSESVAMGDFNNDGHIDFALANPSGNTVSLFLGDGRGGILSAAVSFQVTGSPYMVAAADLDGDGNTDMVTANINGSSIGILYGLGDGTFKAPIYKKVAKSPRHVAIGDINGDGKPDIVVACFDGEAVSTFIQSKPRHFKSHKLFKGHASIWVAIGDVNNDGLADILTANYYEGAVGMLAGIGSGKFKYLSSLVVGGPPYAVEVGDLNRDGKLDIISGNNNPDRSVSVLLNLTDP